MLQLFVQTYHRLLQHFGTSKTSAYPTHFVKSSGLNTKAMFHYIYGVLLHIQCYITFSVSYTVFQYIYSVSLHIQCYIYSVSYTVFHYIYSATYTVFHIQCFITYAVFRYIYSVTYTVFHYIYGVKYSVFHYIYSVTYTVFHYIYGVHTVVLAGINKKIIYISSSDHAIQSPTPNGKSLSRCRI
jgi:hypothetical protein